MKKIDTMIIANPIYDTVFKYLMEDNEAAKRIIGILINEEIVELEFKPTERVRDASGVSLPMFRMDFIATIKTTDGIKRVLIEVQKTKKPTDIERFRSYLGKQYSERESEPLPIIAIYFLGYNIPELPEAVIKVNRILKGIISGQEYNVKNEFVECLTHDAYIIQTKRLKRGLKTPIEKVLSVFDQSYVIQGENEYFLSYPDEPTPEELRGILNRLKKIAADDRIREELELEEEAEWEYYRTIEHFQKEVKTARKEVQLAKDEAQLAKKEMESAKLQAQKRASQIKQAVLLFSNMGISPDEISRKLGLSKEEVLAIIEEK